jgi:hypothetical protein
MTRDEIILTRHAAKRVAERKIDVLAVVAVLKAGEVIAEYTDRVPQPSRVQLGWHEGRPLHVVSAVTPEGQTVVITVYEPSPALWTPDFKRRLP